MVSRIETHLPDVNPSSMMSWEPRGTVSPSYKEIKQKSKRVRNYPGPQDSFIISNSGCDCHFGGSSYQWTMRASLIEMRSRTAQGWRDSSGNL